MATFSKDEVALVKRGFALTADASIEAAETVNQLRSAQFRLDRRLHDLRSEFISRESVLRDEFLSEVKSITGE